MPNMLDHFMWGSADLEAAMAEFEALTGVAPVRGGSHPGIGTRNALASLGPDIYAELIAPDPAQTIDGTFGAVFRALARPQLYAFILKGDDLPALKQVYEAEGYAVDLVDVSRETPDGTVLSWQLIIPQPSELGVYAPFFIDWKDSRHPASTSPGGCTLEAFEAFHPQAERIGALWDRLDVAVPLLRSDAPGFRATLRTPKGPLLLTSAG